MSRHLLLAAALAGAGLLSAQSYFHLEQIAVVPAQPTTSDNVALHLIGQLSDTGAEVQMVEVAVTDFIVDITLVAASDGGFTVLVPHTETVQLGLLAAGTYTVQFTAGSSGLNDMAPAEQHVFTVTGGPPCDELQLGVQWHPFTDTAIVVHATHSGSPLFDYPNFILYNAQGDTLAVETVNFFAIGQDSWHVLRVVDGATVTNDFTGTLELWTGFTSTLACSWEHTFALCPPPTCIAVHPTIMNIGGALVLGEFAWSAHDAQGQAVGSGTWELSAAVQEAADSLCLPPGNYTMQVFPQQEPSGGHAVFTVAGPGGLWGPVADVHQPAPNTMAFTHYGPCMEIGQAVPSTAAAGLRTATANGGLWAFRTDGLPLGELHLFDAQGRLLFAATATQDRTWVPVATPGVYLLRAGGLALRVVAGLE